MKYLIAAALLVISINASAQLNLNKPVVCYDTKILFDQLKNKYKEKPILLAKETMWGKLKTAVFVNAEEKSYTIVEFDDKMACIISLGEEVFLLNPPVRPNS